tara:strand:- start:710 stop:1489 length:780 start_codon:yes stop_codon:yes gene_type:complete
MIKKILILLIIVSITIPLADAVPLSDKTGLKFTFPVKTDGYSFFIEATGNLDISNLDFDKEEKSITLFIISSLENNSLEISIPKELIGGNYTFFIDNVEFFPNVKSGNDKTFVSMDFVGVGKHKIEIFGTTYLETFKIKDMIDYDVSDGYLDDIRGDSEKNSLTFYLFDPGDKGVLSFTLSNELIIPFDDGTFVVLIDDVESNYVVEDGIMKIKFDSNSTKIEVIGTYAIPEFYEIAPLVLASSLILVIVLKKSKKLFT